MEIIWFKNYDQEVKGLIANSLENHIINIELGAASVPNNKINFEGVNYDPQHLLSEIKNRTEIGENLIKKIYDKSIPELEQKVSIDPNDKSIDEPEFFAIEVSFTRDCLDTFESKDHNKLAVFSFRERARMIITKHQYSLKIVQDTYSKVCEEMLRIDYCCIQDQSYDLVKAIDKTFGCSKEK